MKILLYLLIPVLVVAVAAAITWLRNRQPTSLQHGVDSFRREMDALSPDAVTEHRRRTDPSPTAPQERQGPPRRPPSPDRRV